MGRAEFIAQLREAGIEAWEIDQDKVAFTRTIISGAHAGEEIVVGYVIPGNFPDSPPTGPHINRQLWPIHSGGEHPNGGIHASPFGPEWQYWSRPIQYWHTSPRTVRVVLAHLTRLLDTQ